MQKVGQKSDASFFHYFSFLVVFFPWKPPIRDQKSGSKKNILRPRVKPCGSTAQRPSRRPLSARRRFAWFRWGIGRGPWGDAWKGARRCQIFWRQTHHLDHKVDASLSCFLVVQGLMAFFLVERVNCATSLQDFSRFAEVACGCKVPKSGGSKYPVIWSFGHLNWKTTGKT